MGSFLRVPSHPEGSKIQSGLYCQETLKSFELTLSFADVTQHSINQYSFISTVTQISTRKGPGPQITWK